MPLAYRRDDKTTEPRIPATDARVHFGELLQQITNTGETELVERNGREVAAIVPIGTYRRERCGLDTDWRAELRAVQEEWRRRLDPSEPINAADMIREGHRESDAWMADALVSTLASCSTSSSGVSATSTHRCGNGGSTKASR